MPVIITLISMPVIITFITMPVIITFFNMPVIITFFSMPVIITFISIPDVIVLIGMPDNILLIGMLNIRILPDDLNPLDVSSSYLVYEECGLKQKPLTPLTVMKGLGNELDRLDQLHPHRTNAL